MATELYAQAEEADSAIRQNPGNLPKSYQPAHRRSDRNDQSDPAWLGELLSGWQFEPLLRHDQRLVEKKVRRHLMRARQRRGYGWKRWSTNWLYGPLGLFNDYQVRHHKPGPKVAPAR